MYRLWVEHPKFLPPKIAAKLDWRAGEDRGRIYRITPHQEAGKSSFTPPNTRENCVALLADANGWRQFLGQRLLVEQQAKEIVPTVRQLLHHDQTTTRLHALWTLDGLTSLEPSDVVHAMEDSNAVVRADAVTLSRQWLDQPRVFAAVAARAGDKDVHVRFKVALVLSADSSPEATDLLIRLTLADGHDPAFADGLLTSTKDRSGAILKKLVASKEFITSSDANSVDLVKRLASIVGARGNIEELSGLFETLSSGHDESQSDWWHAAMISGLGQGLPRYQGEMGRLTLTEILANPPEKLAASAKNLKFVFDKNQEIASDDNENVIARAAAVELLAYQPFAKSSPLFSELLSNQQPVEVQTACIHALSKNGSTAAAEIVLEQWSELGPAVRGPALTLLLRRTDSTRLALAAMAEGSMNASVLSIDQRVRLLKHSDKSLSAQAATLFGGSVSEDRQQVAKEYEKSLSLTASASEGEKVFDRICAACHRLMGKAMMRAPT